MWEEYKDVQGDLTLGGVSMKDVIDKDPQDVVFCSESSSPLLRIAMTDQTQVNPTTTSPH